jgi:mannose-6-phosphate isomerase-like protein (cupin superfamily)
MTTENKTPLLHVPLSLETAAALRLTLTHNELGVGGSIPSERHRDEVQVVTVLEGEMLVWMSSRPIPANVDAACFMPVLLTAHCSKTIPANIYHRLQQYGPRPVKFVSLYHRIG